MTIYVVLPAFNEAQTLADLLPAIGQTLRPRWPYKIILVDDCSADGTAERVREWSQKVPLVYLRHEINQGYGGAIRTGMTWVCANAQPGDIAITLDADNTHPPAYFPALIEKAETGVDIVTASYTLPGARATGVPLKRRLLSLGANSLFRCSVPIAGTRAYTCGFRAFRVSLLQKVFRRYGEKLIEERGFPGGAELLLKAHACGARTAEIPFDLHYENRGGASKIRIGHTILAYLKLLRRFA
jgi:dolichol-phosphate mannosyltransferase